MKTQVTMHKDSFNLSVEIADQKANIKNLIQSIENLAHTFYTHVQTNVTQNKLEVSATSAPAPIAEEAAQAPVQEEDKQATATDAEPAPEEEAKTEEETTTEQAQEAQDMEQKQEATSKEASQAQEAVQEVKAEPATAPTSQPEKTKPNVVLMPQAKDKAEPIPSTQEAQVAEDDALAQIKALVFKDRFKAVKVKMMLQRFGAEVLTKLPPDKLALILKEVKSA